MNDNSNLTLDKLRDAMRTVTNATTVWYGTSDTLTRGKGLVSTATTPPFVVVHPDDVSLLGPQARHVREYRPTQGDIVKMAQEYVEVVRNQCLTRWCDDPDAVKWLCWYR